MFALIWTLTVGAALGTDSRATRRRDSVHCAASEQRVTVDERTAALPPRPFSAGERLEYGVSFLRLSFGSGRMQLTRDTVAGRPVWRAQFSIDGGFRLVSVHDTSTSWFDTTTFNSFRFVQHLHEPRYHAERDMRISPDRRVYQTVGDSESASVTNPVDEVSLVYLVRTLALEPGQCYEFRRYFQPEGNPIVLHVLRRERVTVPAGTFPAIVVRPEITTGGIFSQEGHAELWLSDDSARVVLQLKSRLAFGSIDLFLQQPTTTPASPAKP